ncbi:hypothetical protein GXW78_09500 [Roseomonas terrae]|jgi:hypothetical protein|uniref:Two pore domain potassium channel family protein n=1 Tax=Neoroseomonas terrae TaxID=424799 RepID=A0ABS5EFW4_9PROT|nr:hypothetical protein [Neoroseomonas terrae]MBR0649898.1 hypothetical protein [Neoroseomonas terrae]
MDETAAVIDIGGWGRSWAVGAPLIVLTVVVHVIGLGLIRAAFHRALPRPAAVIRAPLPHFALVMSVTVSLVTLLHVLQAALWAAAFMVTGALRTSHEAMLYSLGAMTTYGHAAIYLERHWQMLGALEALNGAILLGLSTAFLYAMIQQAWPGTR